MLVCIVHGWKTESTSRRRFKSMKLMEESVQRQHNELMKWHTIDQEEIFLQHQPFAYGGFATV
jgi:hypothetical protein